jgi:hypothetical protein
VGGFNSGFKGIAKETTRLRQRVDIVSCGALAPDESKTLSWSLLGGSILLYGIPDGIVLAYETFGQRRREIVDIERVPCRFGGTRPYFRCPACGRRCGALYATSTRFQCRICADLQYRSTRASPGDRKIERAEKIRWRLGWFPGAGLGHGDKPKGMHWRTYERLVREHDLLADAAWSEFATRLKREEIRLDAALRAVRAGRCRSPESSPGSPKQRAG